MNAVTYIMQYAHRNSAPAVSRMSGAKSRALPSAESVIMADSHLREGWMLRQSAVKRHEEQKVGNSLRMSRKRAYPKKAPAAAMIRASTPEVWSVKIRRSSMSRATPRPYRRQTLIF